VPFTVTTGPDCGFKATVQCGDCDAGLFCDDALQCVTACEGLACGSSPHDGTDCGGCAAGTVCSVDQTVCGDACAGLSCGASPIDGSDCGICPADTECNAEQTACVDSALVAEAGCCSGMGDCPCESSCFAAICAVDVWCCTWWDSKCADCAEGGGGAWGVCANQITSDQCSCMTE
jgi:hypothetical protein